MVFEVTSFERSSFRWFTRGHACLFVWQVRLFPSRGRHSTLEVAHVCVDGSLSLLRFPPGLTFQHMWYVEEWQGGNWMRFRPRVVRVVFHPSVAPGVGPAMHAVGWFRPCPCRPMHSKRPGSTSPSSVCPPTCFARPPVSPEGKGGIEIVRTKP